MLVVACIVATLGYKLALWLGFNGLKGAVIGFFSGYVVALIVSQKYRETRERKFWQLQANQEFNHIFIGSVFTMLGKLAAVDGKIKDQESAVVYRIVSEGLKLKRRERNAALLVFQRARTVATSFQFDAAQYYELYQHDPKALENLLICLFELAVSDGPLNEEEERLIKLAAQVFNFSEDHYAAIRSHFLPERQKKAEQIKTRNTEEAQDYSDYQVPRSLDPYAILGCKKTDSVSEIKNKYRKLVHDYHPDKIVSKNLPEDFSRFAAEKFKTIQAAYETLKSERGFS